MVVPLDILGVRVDLAANTPLVLLREQGDAQRVLPILIGTNEAAAIHSAMEGMTPPRPLTHDLLAAVLDATSVTLQRVVITEVREHTFFAELRLTGPAGATTVSCRPSDGIALAVRTGCPVFATTALMDEAGVQAQPDTEVEAQGGEGAADEAKILDEFRDFLDEINPDDFG